MKEAQVKQEVKRILDEAGAYWYMVVPTGYGRRGVPDFLVCHKGRFLAVETKRENIRTPSPHQAREMRSIEAAGGSTLLINAENLEELKEWLDRGA